MDNGMSWLEADRIVKANPGLTADDIRNIPMADFERMIGRSVKPVEPQRRETLPDTPATPEIASTARSEAVENGFTPVSVRDMTPEQYAAYRKQIGMGQSTKEGRGIFDSVSSRSDTYTNAARAQSGRTAWVGSNVEEAPRISRPNLVNVDRPNLDARPLSERFGTR